MKIPNLKTVIKAMATLAEKNASPTCSALILAGGNSTRMGGRSKQLIAINGIPVIIHTALAFQNCPEVSEIIIVCKESEEEFISAQLKKYNIDKFKCFARNGDTRFLSARSGFEKSDIHVDLVAIHDAARCLITSEQISNVIKTAKKTGAAIAAYPAVDTIKTVDEKCVINNTIDRKTIWNAQTPQIFSRPMIEVGYYVPRDEGFEATDDSILVESLGFKVTPVDCGRNNLKITVESDVKLAEAILNKGDEMEKRFKVGHGYDVHRLVEGRKMILGGVEIPYHLGLLGHSDADVLCHAISDAILGAIGGRDIGFHFPDKDPKYEGISSILLLQKVGELAFEKGAEISNIDATIVLQEPHVSKYITTMEENVARALNIKVEDVNIKATTEEKLGFTGNGDGIASHAVCLVYTK